MGELHVRRWNKDEEEKNDFQNNITYYSYYRGMYYDSALSVDDPDVTEDGQRVHIHEPVYLFPGNSAVGELS